MPALGKRLTGSKTLVALALAAALLRRVPAPLEDPARSLSNALRGHSIPVALPCLQDIRWDAAASLPPPSANILEIASRAARLSEETPTEQNRCVEVASLVISGKIDAAIARARDLIGDLQEPGASTLATVAGALSLGSRELDRLDALDTAERARSIPGAELAGSFNARRSLHRMTAGSTGNGATHPLGLESLFETNLASLGADAAIERDLPLARFLFFDRWVPRYVRQPARRLSAEVLALGEALTRLTGDRLPGEIALEITKGHAPPAAFVAAESARTALDEQQPERAMKILAPWPDKPLDERAAPSHFLLELQKGRALHYLDRDGVAGPSLARLEALARQRGFVGLAGRAAAVLGAQASRSGRLDVAIAAYSRAEKMLESAGENAAACHVAAIHAGLLREMGLESAAWKLHERSFRLITPFAHPRHEYMAYAMAAETALVEGRPHASARLNQESLTVARSWGDSTAVAEETAHLLHARSRPSADYRALARAASAGSASSVMTSALQSDLALLEADSLRDRLPETALELLAIAESALIARRDDFRRATLLVSRSATLSRLGRGPASDAASWSALSALSAAMKSPLRPQERLAVQDRWHEATRQLVSNAWRRGDARLALAILDGSRATATNDLATPLPGLVELLDRIDGVVRDIPSGSVSLSVLAFEHETLLFRLDRSGIRGTALDIGRSALRTMTRSIRRRILSQRAFEPEATQLYELLIRPLHPLPPGMLYISTDGSVAGLPWAALLDSRSRRYLIERCGIALSPSIAPARVRRQRARTEPQGTLVVSSSAAFPDLGLEGLPGAALEAKSIAAIHPGSTFLSDRGATLSTVLARLPDVRIAHFSGHATQTSSGDLNLLFGEPSANQGSMLDALAEVPIVILSACGTASGRLSETAGASGLATLLGRGGGGSRVATLADVEDTQQTAFMIGLHRKLRNGQSLREAFRASCLEALETGHPASVWAFPALLSRPQD